MLKFRHFKESKRFMQILSRDKSVYVFEVMRILVSTNYETQCSHAGRKVVLLIVGIKHCHSVAAPKLIYL
jgi:hypothetical protein